MSIPRDIIVIGAAEGSLPSLSQLLTNLPVTLTASILIALHTPLDALRLDTVLDQAGSLPTVYAQEGQYLFPGCIHLAPPDTEMVIRSSGLLGMVCITRPAMCLHPEL